MESKKDIKDIWKYWIFKDIKQHGEFDLPLIQKSNVVPDELVPFNYVNTLLKNPNLDLSKYYVHFFIDDYQFNRVWENPKRYVSMFQKFGGIIMPDFSVYTNFPKAVQIHNVWKSRLLAFYYQKMGIDVIPNITWSDEASLDWTLDGIPKNSVVAVSSNGCLNNLVVDEFIRLFNIVMEQLEPIKIVFLGKVPTNLKDDRIIHYPGHLQKMKAKGV